MGYDEDADEDAIAAKAPFEQMVPNFSDPRLEGWVPVRQYLVPDDWRYDLLDVRPHESGSLFSRRQRLLVDYEIVRANGVRQRGDYPFEYERPREVDLRELGGLLEYVKRIPQRAQFYGELVAAGDGPFLDNWVVGNAEITAGNLEILRRWIEEAAAGTMPPEIAWDCAKSIAEAAYRLGRQVREDELKAGHESDATRGVIVKQRTAVGANMTIEKRRFVRAAHKRHALALAANALNGPPPAGHRVWKLTPLAEEVSAGWKEDGAKPSVVTIRALLRECKDAGEDCLASVS
ncbi:MAG: hypothetical protein PSX79_13295 [bacterium]|nr:hypothetical protein [bacterium]